jgi:hypothetical protein
LERQFHGLYSKWFNYDELKSEEEQRAMLDGVPVPTTWRVLGLLMEERPPDMEGSCEYIE